MRNFLVAFPFSLGDKMADARRRGAETSAFRVELVVSNAVILQSMGSLAQRQRFRVEPAELSPMIDTKDIGIGQLPVHNQIGPSALDQSDQFRRE